MKKFILLIFGIIVFSSVVYATSHLPEGLLKIQQYNNSLAQEFLQNISFVIAFLAGMASILSPCILPLLPAYFAITFKERKKITLATSVFFLGFTFVFILMGILATLTGSMLSMVFADINWLIPLAGFILIIFGIMIFIGKGFPGISVKRKVKSNIIGIFIAGALFAIGWTACIGPVVSGILLMTAAFKNYLTTVYLMFAYSLGIFVPLFILSFFHDKLKIDKIGWLNKEKTFEIGGKKIHTTVPNAIAGIIFVILGLMFIIFQGTGIFNNLQMFGLKEHFYTWQNALLDNIGMFNTVGIIIFSIFALVIIYFLVKEIRNK